MKTIFRYLSKAVVVCILAICCTSCEFDTAMKRFGIPNIVIYAPNTTIAVENIQIEKCYDQKTHRTKTYTARTYYDTISIQQCRCINGDYMAGTKTEYKRAMHVMEETPDYKYLKLTRLSGNSPVYVTTEYRINIDSVEFDIRNFEDGNKFAPEGYSLQEIMEKLYKEGKAERWDDNEQHKVLRDE